MITPKLFKPDSFPHSYPRNKDETGQGLMIKGHQVGFILDILFEKE